MSTIYYNNSKNTAVKRKITEITKFDADGETINKEETNYALLQYHFPTPQTLSPKKRKGTSGNYNVSMAPSCKRRINEAVKSTKGPRTILSDLCGSALNHTVPGSCPKNLDQIKYSRKKLRSNDKPCDEINEVLLFATQDDFGIKSIHNFQLNSKGSRFVFALQPQVDEIIKLCSESSSVCGVLCIDTTFNIGKYFMTPTCYHVPDFINTRTGKPVIVPGPCLFHMQEESYDVYLYFVHTLIEMSTSFDKIRFIGGDRGRGQRGFLYPLRCATFLPCTRHVQNNIKEQIPDSKLQKAIFCDLFGSQRNKTKGLIDCNHFDFEQQVAELYKKWPDVFVSYFKTHVEQDFKEGMLADVRSAVGLGDELFYNNGLECLNKKLKTKKLEYQVNKACGSPTFKACTLFEGIVIYKKLVFEERTFLHQAVFGNGPYLLSSQKQNLKLCENVFCNMTYEEKRKYLLQLDPFMKDGYGLVEEIEKLGQFGACV